MIKNPGIFLLLFFLLILGADLFVSSCASRSAPSGGPKDTLAPVLDTSFPPNYSINFNSKEVILVFNEYITLKDPTGQINFSPPLAEKPKVVNRGKEVLIHWTDTLLDSTTYTISFGNAITDFTEGNVNDNLKYVFSTGDFIDSLELRGTVIDSKTGQGVPEIMVALYDYATLKKKDSIPKTDSIPFLNIPTYYDYTDETGAYELSNLKYGNFHVVAFEDARGNFKMSTGTEQMAFSDDTLRLTDTTQPLNLIAFNPNPTPRSYAPRHVSKGLIQFPFNYPVPDLEITEVNEADTAVMDPILIFNRNQDTVSYWFEAAERDSIKFLIQLPERNTDTAVVFLRNYTTPDFKLSPISKEIKFNEPISLSANLPIDTAIYDSMLVITPKDSLGAPVEKVENADPLRISIEPSKRAKQFSLYLKERAVQSVYDTGNDSVVFQFASLTREDLGNLDFIVETDSSRPLVLVIYDPNKKEIFRQSFQGNLTAQLQHQKPGVYNMELILDDNRDGKWTTGSYLEKRQPEEIISYKDQAEIRANWDMELIWQPEELNQASPPSDTLSLPSDSTNSSRSDKN